MWFQIHFLAFWAQRLRSKVKVSSFILDQQYLHGKQEVTSQEV